MEGGEKFGVNRVCLYLFSCNIFFMGDANFTHTISRFSICLLFQKVILKAKIHTTQLMTTIIIIGKSYSEPSSSSLSHCLQSGSRTDRGDGVWRYF